MCKAYLAAAGTCLVVACQGTPLVEGPYPSRQAAHP
jgi:hypothetical protein